MLRASDEEAMRAASLCTQLPDGSRVLCALDPDHAWTVTDFLLRQIEYDLRRAFWDGKGDEPVPITAPGDEMRAEREAEQELADVEMVSALIPGIDLGGETWPQS